MVRQGNCGGALMVLMDPETWRGLTLRQYGLWSSDVWKALFETAKRRYFLPHLKSFDDPTQST